MCADCTTHEHVQFDMMECEQMVQDMICVYNKKSRQFHTVVRVGRDVCGCAFSSCTMSCRVIIADGSASGEH
jgi:hypothetical protein